jgi:hypothetical protein
MENEEVLAPAQYGQSRGAIKMGSSMSKLIGSGLVLKIRTMTVPTITITNAVKVPPTITAPAYINFLPIVRGFGSASCRCLAILRAK